MVCDWTEEDSRQAETQQTVLESRVGAEWKAGGVDEDCKYVAGLVQTADLGDSEGEFSRQSVSYIM